MNPYVCSAPSCNRSFLIRSGWVRHENVCEKVHDARKHALEENKLKFMANKRSRKTLRPIRAGTHESPSSSLDHLTGDFPDEHTSSCDEDPVYSAPAPPTPPPPEPPVLSAAGRIVRPRILPARYRDIAPPPPKEPTILHRSPSPPPQPEGMDANTIPRMHLFRSERNNFGLYKVFRRACLSEKLPPTQSATPDFPMEDPTSEPKSLYDPYPTDFPIEDPTSEPKNLYDPFPNYSSYGLSRWFWSGSPAKTLEDLYRLVALITSPEFKAGDLRGVNFRNIYKQLSESSIDEVFDVRDGWIQSKLTIPVPLGHLNKQAPKSADFEVDQFLHRPLTEVIRSVFSSKTQSAGFCYEPYEMRYTPALGEPDMAVYGELYWSKMFRDAHEEVQLLPRAENDDLPRAVVGLQFWSDGMAAATFGSAKLWPAYLQFGNQSKYERAKAGPQTCHHIAHIPSLPKSFKDFIQVHGKGKKTSAALETHCRREVMQAVWRTILDKDFLHAWEHGIVVKCGDGVQRRLYPRIFTYSADYPEKVLLSTIRSLGKHPCPRCLVEKKDISRLGKPSDYKVRRLKARVDNPERRRNVHLARKYIFDSRKRVSHKNLDVFLDGGSLTPIENAFSDLLGPFGFDFHSMLVVDVLHEWEVGVWRGIFTHLVRILSTFTESDKVNELDNRVRSITPFSDTIRRYNGNISEMKQMTAYSFEDLLQIALPAFDGLLPEPHERNVRNLIYIAATVHSLAKLRIHTDATIASLDRETMRLGDALRKFQKVTCSAFATTELAQESQRRMRTAQRKGGGASTSDTIRPTIKKTFNINTPKIHALGDYARQIVLLGSTDSYSTAIGETEHKRSKQNYRRTNRVNFVKQVTQVERRQTNLKRINERIKEAAEDRVALKQILSMDQIIAGTEAGPGDEPELEDNFDVNTGPRYQLSKKGTPFVLGYWLFEHKRDSAIEGFHELLLDHLLVRLQGLDSLDDEQSFSEVERRTVEIVKNMVFNHKKIQINYTTYDLQRRYDSINPSSHNSDVMILARACDTEDTSGFWYARVIGIYHLDAYLKTSGDRSPSRIDFLWVRWLGKAVEDEFGDSACRLERVRFVTTEDGSPPFGFIDPADVIRAAHLIPAFRHGRTKELLGPSSLARVKEAGSDDDWESFYVNRFADRDIFMHHRGGGVGHSTGLNASVANSVPEGLYARLGVDVAEDVGDVGDVVSNGDTPVFDVEALFELMQVEENLDDDECEVEQSDSEEEEGGESFDEYADHMEGSDEENIILVDAEFD